jgi:hypothetical protein
MRASGALADCRPHVGEVAEAIFGAFREGALAYEAFHSDFDVAAHATVACLGAPATRARGAVPERRLRAVHPERKCVEGSLTFGTAAFMIGFVQTRLAYLRGDCGLLSADPCPRTPALVATVASA